ncbi:uncharacterized protein KZ484_004114 isoform 1-T1 [Pholidichthys leucotaenia]
MKDQENSMAGGDMTKREKLQDVLSHYATHTLAYIHTVRGFCDGFSKWMLTREEEVKHMADIKTRADKIDLNFSHITKSENTGKACVEFFKSKVTQMTSNTRRTKLQMELAKVLKDTLKGLKELHFFLAAVEKLAVTSLHVFKENQVVQLPIEIDRGCIQAAITASQQICPLLLEFKRDPEVFFLPKLQNIDVLEYQLGRYLETSRKFCKKFKKRAFSRGYMNLKTVIDLSVDLSEDDIQRMIKDIDQLTNIRMDPNFRMVFLFQRVSCSGFIKEFSERQPRMLQFLQELEEAAGQLDGMNKAAKLSSVAGSSVAAVGGVLSIAGLVLSPVTAGVSLTLTMTGVGLGIASAASSAVTSAAGVGVNRKHQKKASEVFESFMKDVQSLQDYLQKVSNQPSVVEVSEMDMIVMGKIVSNVNTVAKGIDSLVDGASAVQLLQSKDAITSAGKVMTEEGKTAGNISRVASDASGIGQTALSGSLAMTTTAAAGAISGLFLGMDIFFICKDSIGLARGSETSVSQAIRARAALWNSEMNSWQKIHDCLNEGLLTSDENQRVIDTPFYRAG